MGVYIKPAGFVRKALGGKDEKDFDSIGCVHGGSAGVPEYPAGEHLHGPGYSAGRTCGGVGSQQRDYFDD
jgi:hypothetical protein